MKCFEFVLVLICNIAILINLTTTQPSPDAAAAAATVKLKADFEHGDACLQTGYTTCVIGHIKRKLKLKCTPSVPLASNQTINWFKGDANKTNKGILVKSVEKRIDVGESWLDFFDLQAADVGIYHCRVGTKGQEDYVVTPIAEEHIQVQVVPRFKDLSEIKVKDITFVEDSTINLTCQTEGTVDRVTWTFREKPLNFSDTRIKLQPIGSTPDAILLINPAHKTLDRGAYNCTAISQWGNTTGGYNIRIKSKYAALGPFLGICAEVIILCAIILIYEKRRDKTELEESDTDQGPETKNSPDHGQDSVRYRK